MLCFRRVPVCFLVHLPVSWSLGPVGWIWLALGIGLGALELVKLDVLESITMRRENEGEQIAEAEAGLWFCSGLRELVLCDEIVTVAVLFGAHTVLGADRGDSASVFGVAVVPPVVTDCPGGGPGEHMEARSVK